MIRQFMKLFMSKEKLFALMTYKLTSDKNISNIVSEFEPACEKFNFALLHHYIYHDVVKSKGFPINRKVYIYEICQAKVAAAVLTDEPEFAPFMPCRIAIYEDTKGVSISTQNMQMMIDVLKDNEELLAQTNELFGKLKQLMKDII